MTLIEMIAYLTKLKREALSHNANYEIVEVGEDGIATPLKIGGTLKAIEENGQLRILEGHELRQMTNKELGEKVKIVIRAGN